ncbi:MAG: hypothetical protein JXJ04_17210 [Spirochaetales bacterium]|nr:hypothetical protein [Spirochaetales bacterium]
MISIPGNSKEKEKGYILFDVLITLLILSLVMTSILGGFSLLGSLVGKSWERSQIIIQDRNDFDKIQRIPTE